MNERITIKVIERYLRYCFRVESPPRVTELARFLGVSRVTLNRWARHNLRASTSDYLKEQQLSEAMRLLRDTSMSTTSIGYRAGFGTRRTFYRAFTRRTGIGPAEYRL